MNEKIVTRDTAVRRLDLERSAGRRIVFTNGCFDLLHRGHVHYLEAARRLGERLVVGLNSDASVTRIKGPHRPINPQADRAEVLAALACVDLVVIFDEDDPLRLITRLRPDVLVKGADWQKDKIVGADLVLAAGGRVETIAVVPDVSTTILIDRIMARYAGSKPA